MKFIKCISFVLIFTSCDVNDIFDIPTGDIAGDYNYLATSVYFDDRGQQYQTSRNQGVMDFNTSFGYINVTPLLGWEYTLALSDVVSYTLSDGSGAESYRIRLQNSFVNSEEFNIRGTTNTNLNDGGAVIGTYDGVAYDGGDVEFEIESFDIETGYSVITTFEAVRVN